MAKHKMTAKQKKFCDFFIETGNATQSAITAGYRKNTARSIASENLTKPYIRDYIKERNDILEGKRIANMKEVKEFWTKLLRDSETDANFRLKASEYIAKTNGAFLDKVEHSGTVNTSVTIVDDIK